MSEKSVTVIGLTKKFGNFTAVSDVSFEVLKGEIFGFLGANGAGKSTTIRMLCGILPPSGGTGIVAGYDILENSRMVRQSIGYMSQKFSLYEELTVIENMRFFAKLYSVPASRFEERLKTCVELVRLSGYEETKAKSLSAGIRQRLSLACAIIHEPQVIFLDEPTSGVDPISRRNFWDLIYSFASKGVTIFVTTHYMDEAEYCDRIAMISAGKLSAIGTPEELKTVQMEQDVFVVTGCNLFSAAERLRSVPQVFDVGLLSDSVRVLSRELSESDISDILSGGGIDANVERAGASLEDVFVSLAGRGK